MSSAAVIGLFPEEVHCPCTPTMRPLKLKAQLLSPNDLLYLPEKANASVSKHDPSQRQPDRRKKTIMNFLREKEANSRCL